MNETDARVTGLGGIFFKVENPEATRAWYKDNLGLVTNEYGSLFEFNDKEGNTCYAQWSPFANSTTYFAPSEKEFMINFRVHGIESLYKIFQDNGVTILDTIESYEYGKFLHIMDSEGNKIELWEPVDNVFTRLYEGKTTNHRWIDNVTIVSSNPKALREWYTFNLGISFKNKVSELPFNSSQGKKTVMNFGLIFKSKGSERNKSTGKDFSISMCYPKGDSTIEKFIENSSQRTYFTDIDNNIIYLNEIEIK